MVSDRQAQVMQKRSNTQADESTENKGKRISKKQIQ